jgi:hypothetical protein
MIDRIEIGVTYNTHEALEILGKRLDDGFQIIGHSSYTYDGEVTELYTLYKPEKSAAIEETQGALVMTQITMIQRDETKNNQRPMWRCETATGEKVNIFLNVDDPSKDSFNLFEKAGWGDFLMGIYLYSQAQAEIYVALRKDGQWWNIVAVNPAPSIKDYDVPSEADNG